MHNWERTTTVSERRMSNDESANERAAWSKLLAEQAVWLKRHADFAATDSLGPARDLSYQANDGEL